MRTLKFSCMSYTLLVLSLMTLVDLGIAGSGLGEWSGDRVLAASSAGRSGGGSFKRSSPTKATNAKPTTTSPNNKPNNATVKNRTRTIVRPSGSNTTIIAPVVVPGGGAQTLPNQNYSNGNNTSGASAASAEEGSWIVWLLIILAMGGIGLIAYLLWRSLASGGSTASDLDNDTVTVSKLQVALLAEAREVQAKLTEISLETDTDSPEGLLSLLQESALALLRTPENWTHVLGSSKAVQRDRAESEFNAISVEERRKFSAETLVNVNGKTRTQKSFVPTATEDPAAYIVVTLIIGTEHDKPLFGEIKSREALQETLEKIAIMSASHLLIFELLWSPQTETDSLTYDELISEYTNMIQV